MKVLTVYAHHDPRSFCHQVLERFTAGLADAGHASQVVDLHAIGYPGIENVEHVYFYAATAAPPETIRRYLEQAYQLGREFERPAAGAAPTASRHPVAGAREPAMPRAS